MEDVIHIASYIAHRYRQEYGCRIGEMKLHKLLYFTQREALVQTGEPLFEASFYGWKYGPVLKEIRDLYRSDSLYTLPSEDVIGRYQSVFDKVFSQYAIKDSLSLSRLSHGELSWKNSRKGLSYSDKGDVKMALEDIRKDADRIRLRRRILKEMGVIKLWAVKSSCHA